MDLYRYHHASEVDLEARDEAMGMLADLVKESLDADAVETWVRAAPINLDVSDVLVVGEIRWPRSLGRPDTPSLVDGFVITTSWWAEAGHATPEGWVNDITAWIPDEVMPNLRENLSNAEDYSVRYLFRAQSANGQTGEPDTQVEVRLADVAWRHPGRAARHRQYLSSHGFQFHRDGHFLRLPNIIVAGQPFARP
jgi:hypothetical protein